MNRTAASQPAATAWRPARTAAAIIAAAALALLMAACGGSPSSTGSGGSSDARGSTTSPSAVAYSALHALPRRAELPRPRQQRTGPQGRPAATRGQQFPVPGGPASLPALAPEHGGAINADSIQQCMMAGDCPQALVQQVERACEFRPVHALARGAELARSHLDTQGRPVSPSTSARRLRPVFAADLGQRRRMLAPDAGDGRTVGAVSP